MTKSNETAVAVAMLVMIAALAFPTSTAQAQRPDSCLGGTLTPPNPAGSDLVVKGPVKNGVMVPLDCKVGAGTYTFGNVYILAGGTLDFTDATIDFWASNILVENGGALTAGSPGAPIGTQDIKNVVTIHLYGPDQGVGGKGISCLAQPNCGIPDNVWSSNGSSKVALPGGVTDYFYQYDTLPFDDGNPQGYFGYKILAVSYGGSLQLFGKKGVASPEPTSSSTSRAGAP